MTPAASGNQRNAPPVSADAPRQGEAGGRQATDAPAESLGASIRESGHTAGNSAPAAAQHDIRSRSVTALTPAANEPEPSGGPGGGSSESSSGGGSAEASSGGGARSADRAPRVAISDLPWLTMEQLADLKAKRRRLTELQERPQSPQVRDDLESAVSAVNRAERKIALAHWYLEASRYHTMRERDWRALYFALETGKWELPGQQGLLNAALGRLATSDEFSAEDARLVNDLQKRFDDVHDLLRATGPSWRCQTRPIRTALPAGTQGQLAVESHHMPGNVLRVHVGRGTSAETTQDACYGDRYFLVPDLTLAGLTNTGGQMLYAGFRHGLLHAGELNGELLARLRDDELHSVLSGYRQSRFTRLYAKYASDEDLARSVQTVGEQARTDCSRIRKLSGDDLEDWARWLQNEAGITTLTQLITAAVYADPEYSSKALRGDAIEVNFFSIALLTPEDVELWRCRPDRYLHGSSFGFALGQLEEQGPAREFTAAANVRQCVLSPLGERLTLHDGDGAGRQATERLLGPLDDSRPGGDVGAAVATIEARASRSLAELEEYRQRHTRTAGELGTGHPLSSMVARQVSRLQDDTQRLRKDARTLKEAGAQLKAMWDRGGWPSSPDACIQAAARLALVGHLTGEMPLLSCASGRDFTQRVEQEAQYLAAVADARNGQLPPVDSDLREWSEVRQAFAHPPPRMDQVPS